MSTNHDVNPDFPESSDEAAFKPVELPPINRDPLEDESNAAYVKYTPGLDKEPIFGDLLPDSAPLKRRSSFIDRERPAATDEVSNESYLAATPGLEDEQPASTASAAASTPTVEAEPEPTPLPRANDLSADRREALARKQAAEREADEARRERESEEQLVEPRERWADSAKPKRLGAFPAILSLLFALGAVASAVVIVLGLLTSISADLQGWIGAGEGVLAVLFGLIAVPTRSRGLAIFSILLGILGGTCALLLGLGLVPFAFAV